MKIINKFRSYILEDEFSMNVSKDKIDIMNYTTIGQIDTNKMIIYYDGGVIIINGKNLTLLKMLDDEILISGSISNIELK